jgi:hypothetical protein
MNGSPTPGNLGPTKLRIARENKERKTEEDCPRNTRKDAKKRREKKILREILRTMPSFSGKLSEPFWRETAWRVVACSSSGVAGNASLPLPAAQVYQVFFSPLLFACFAGNFSPLCSRVLSERKNQEDWPRNRRKRREKEKRNFERDSENDVVIF